MERRSASTLPEPPESFERRVVIYTSMGCSYCVMALRLLEREGVDFEKVDVSRNREARRWLLERTGRRTVPQIFVDGRSIGGYEDLVELRRSGELDGVLPSAPAA